MIKNIATWVKKRMEEVMINDPLPEDISPLDEDSTNVINKHKGKTIAKASFNIYGNDNTSIVLTFTDGSAIKMHDDGQDCCERRYLTCEDDINDLVGKKFTDVVFHSFDLYSTYTNEFGDKDETAFVQIKTDSNSITLCTHNEHNGYYSGIYLVVEEVNVL